MSSQSFITNIKLERRFRRNREVQRAFKNIKQLKVIKRNSFYPELVDEAINKEKEYVESLRKDFLETLKDETIEAIEAICY